MQVSSLLSAVDHEPSHASGPPYALAVMAGSHSLHQDPRPGVYLFAHAHQVHCGGKQDPLHHQQDPDLGAPPAFQGLGLGEAGKADNAPLCMGQDHPSDLT